MAETGKGGGSVTKIDKSFFRYVWRNSRREQIAILLVVLASLPLYFWSLDLPKTIVNDAIQGKAFIVPGSEAAPLTYPMLKMAPPS